jgi:hypothetical protein
LFVAGNASERAGGVGQKLAEEASPAEIIYFHVNNMTNDYCCIELDENLKPVRL